MRFIKYILNPKWVLVEANLRIPNSYWLGILLLNRYIIGYYKGSFIIVKEKSKTYRELEPCEFYNNDTEVKISEYIYVYKKIKKE